MTIALLAEGSIFILLCFLVVSIVLLYFPQRLLDRDAAEAGSSIVYPEVNMTDRALLIWSGQEILREPKHKLDRVATLVTSNVKASGLYTSFTFTVDIVLDFEDTSGKHSY